MLELVEVEGSTLICLVKLWLTESADAAGSLTAVGMVVQDLSVGISGSTGAIWEAYWNGNAAEEGLSVGELGGLKEDGRVVVNFSDRLVGPNMHWEENLAVELLWMEEQTLVMIEVRAPRLVEDVISDDVWV